MAKGNNAAKSNRSHNYKPYDASNSSFFKRITSRVSDILPGQAWISGWLSNTPQLDVRQERDDEDDEEEVRRQPPTKRICLPTTINDYTHQNHVKRHSDLQDDSKTISPISRVDYNDGAVAGPSGLHLRRPIFVSSTPATTQTTSQVITKVNAGDDGSDSSESTSGCSSLVPQAVRTSGNTTVLLPKHSIESKKEASSSGSVRRLSTTKDNSKLNLSANSSRPSFDTYIFHNPHRSLNSSRNNQLDDSSTFYKGRTMYGGASANRDALNVSIMTPLLKPRITNVKPVFKQSPVRDTIGTSALKIFRALEQISTPVTEAKKMALSIPQQKRRKPIQPFEEMPYLQMPALLRIKRKHRSEASSSPSTSAQDFPNKDAPDASSSVVSIERSSSSGTTIVTTTAEKPAQPLPPYSLRVEESNEEGKYLTGFRGRKNRFIIYENLEEVNLPSVKLNITSLPKFSSLPPVSKSVPVTRITSSSTNLLSPSHHSSPSANATTITATTTTTTETTTSVKPQISSRITMRFKFSDPIVENPDGHKLTSIKSLFKFSNPLDAENLKQENLLQNHNKLSKDNKNIAELEQNSGRLIMKANTTNYQLKKKIISQDKSNVLEIKKSSNFQTGGSIMDFFNKNKSISIDNKEKSLPSSNINDTPNNSVNDSNTTKNKPLTPLSALFKKAAGSWECDTCMVSNKGEDTICVSCSTPKQQISIEKQLSSDNKWSCKKCLVENKSDNCVKCGISRIKDNTVNDKSSKDDDVKSSGFIKCKTCFSMYKVSDNNKCPTCTKIAAASCTTIASSTSITSTSSAALPPLSALFKKSTGSWECDTCMVSNKGEDTVCISCSTPKPGSVPPKVDADKEISKPKFQFGIPTGAATGSAVGGFKFGLDQSINADKTKNTSTTSFDGFKFENKTNTSTKSITSEFKFGIPVGSNALESNKTFGSPSQESVIKNDENEQCETTNVPINKLFAFGNLKANDKNVNEKQEDTKVLSSDVQPPKKVSFGQPLEQVKTLSSESSCKSFNFSNATTTKSETQNTNVFSFAAKTPLFGNTLPTSTSDNPSAASALFKFGNSTVSSTTPISTAPCSITTAVSTNSSDISSALITSNADNVKTSSTFSFLSNSAPKLVFPSSEVDKEEMGIFGGFNVNDKTSQFTKLAAPSPANFTFGNSSSDNKTNASKECKKAVVTNSIFGEKTDNEPSSLFNIQSQNEDKSSNIFGSTKTESKPLFFNTTKANENVGIFGISKTNDWNPKPPLNFGSEPSVPTSSTIAIPFGGSQITMGNNIEAKDEPFVFKTTPSTQPNNITPFIFKAGNSEVADSKPSASSFAFTPGNSAQQQLQNSGNVFGSNTQQAPNMFATNTLFNTTTQAPPSNPTGGPSFTFRSQQQQPQQSQEGQGLFNFGVSSQSRSIGPSTAGPTFAFGSQNLQSITTPTPTFDPNIKPNFNFSGGATPTFSAPTSGVEERKENEKRKIKKGVRRLIR